MSMIVPHEIDETVLAFAKSISESPLEYVPVEPKPYALTDHCFGSVAAHIQRGNGGEQVKGWAIWIKPGVLIEAEHHAVWRSDDGKLIDVTPKTDREDAILFLPDDSATLVRGASRNNIRKALINDLTVHTMIKTADKFYPYFTKISNNIYMDEKTQKSAKKAFAAKEAALQKFALKFP